MHLIYLDESGNTGNNLSDREQPLFVLCALVVPESLWLVLERDLQGAINKTFPVRPDDFEVHGADLRRGTGAFAGKSVDERIAFRDTWLRIAARPKLAVVYRAIAKPRYQNWMVSTFGTGVSINPHVVAFPLVATVIDEHLRSLPGKPLGMFISDENQEIVRDVEKSIRILRGLQGILRLGQIVEKGFFIESHQSLPLQLCDLIAMTLRKHEEVKAGRPAKSFDQSAYAIIEPLIHRGKESLSDVLAWLAEQQKKQRPGT